MLQRAAFRLAGWQVVLTGIVAAGAGWLGGSASGLSAATGGSIGIIAGTYDPDTFPAADIISGAEQLGRNLRKIIGDGKSYLLLHERDAGTLGAHCYQRFKAEAARMRVP